MSPADAVATFFESVAIATPQLEYVPLDFAHGRILAQRIDADRDYPAEPRSAMDGFAVAASGIPGTLRIVGEIAMGTAWNGFLAAGAALHIPTGGVVPDGADVVIPIEDTVVRGDSVSIQTRVQAGENINPRASDMACGEGVLFSGTRIGGSQLGVLATLGVTSVPVLRRPIAAIVSSGDELVPPDQDPEPGQVRDSNRYALAGTLAAMGLEVMHVPTTGDDPGALESAIASVLGSSDAVFITGGSSVGERDRTPEAIGALGKPGVLVHGIRVKPGKPTVLAAIGNKPIVGLPGNPTSALMILEAVAAPIVERLTGATSQPPQVDAILDAPAKSRLGWTWYVPVALQHEGTTFMAHPLPLRSSMVSLTARAGGYLEIGPEQDEIPAGSPVRIRLFR